MAAAASTRIVLGLCVALVVASSAFSQLLLSQEEIACGDDILTCVHRLVEANEAALEKVQDGEAATTVSFKPDDCCKTIVAKRGKACGCRLRKTLLDDNLTFGTADFCVSAEVCE